MKLKAKLWFLLRKYHSTATAVGEMTATERSWQWVPKFKTWRDHQGHWVLCPEMTGKNKHQVLENPKKHSLCLPFPPHNSLWQTYRYQCKAPKAPNVPTDKRPRCVSECVQQWLQQFEHYSIADVLLAWEI